ncbi:glycosyl hydrolase family 20, catalytic domain protein [Sphingobacterium spiritivorum ATCC 33300]|uniref:beta-N-acetylhexosaminidase n=1 Tax=Sphingobacterium spiritivorum ATCC 33300 TaxID=525372 RepID=C2G0H0_SPHSI|nr:family 20 glycosylhydrolase [Sphingobacterium spiritivorum]EEI91350.1 glycosyl hydrolase family 20, catalytic domain protein [Sphingobacterium spiritivorum ATCC 33300]QQS97450.1 family 20 glycosylhydrolase [Sphingobacterium spiritivorum]
MRNRNWASLAVTILMGCSYQAQAQDIALNKALQVNWKIDDTKSVDESSRSMFIVKNVSKKPVNLKDWTLMFNYLFLVKEDKGNTNYRIEHRNGDLYALQFLQSSYQEINPNDSLIVSFDAIAPLRNTSKAPGGLYFINQKGKIYDVPQYAVLAPKRTNTEVLEILGKQYEFNTKGNTQQGQLILPTPLSLTKSADKTFALPSKLTVKADLSFRTESNLFVNDLKNLGYKSSLSSGNDAAVRLERAEGMEEEEYTLTVDGSGILIRASSAAGAFYGLQSLKSILPPVSNNADITLAHLQVKDKPRFKYRGFMMDVSRNFQDKQMVLKMLDAMAMYKLNVFHFHFTEDEAWRIEIPGLPELTEVGSQRSASFADGLSLQPAYRSGAAGKGRQYYTTKDYIEILRYAKARHITVVPEIETPGHARAAIKSMQARYEKYMKQGNQAEAEKYLLYDLQDKSEYNSAQNWNDNVMNPALPSTYTFIAKVVDELKVMHKAAGVELKTIHLGGDEVPVGVWEKSPKIAELMSREGIKSVNQVWPYYVSKINNLVHEKGLIMEGWEEMGMHNEGKGMVVNPKLADQRIQVDVWNNLIGGGQEDLAYKLANAGYKVIFASASNFYLDMAWTPLFEEPGLNWAAYINLREAYSFAPENFFLNVLEIAKGKAKGAAYFKPKERLTAAGRKNFLGVKGALWAETVESPAHLEYLIFPRFMAVAERAWSPEKKWEVTDTYDVRDFDKDYAAFSKKLGAVELPKLDKLNGGYQYRMPAVGVRIENNNALINTEYPTGSVRYTTDGTVPTKTAATVENGMLKLEKGKTYSLRAFSSTGREGKVIRFTY